jgi:iron complex transport system permease protein
MQELVFWLLGSVSERGLEHLLLLGPALLAGGLLLWRERTFLAALTLGETVAESLGFRFARHSRRVVAASAVLVGAAVSVAGSIGFVGLVVPHLMRPLVDHRPDRLLLPSALAGAILVSAADLLVRLLPPGRELKLGVITTIIGAPFLIALIWKDRHRWL